MQSDRLSGQPTLGTRRNPLGLGRALAILIARSGPTPARDFPILLSSYRRLPYSVPATPRIFPGSGEDRRARSPISAIASADIAPVAQTNTIGSQARMIARRRRTISAVASAPETKSAKLGGSGVAETGKSAVARVFN